MAGSDPKTRLEELRARARMEELRAKSSGATEAPAEEAAPENPSQRRVSYARKALGGIFPPLGLANMIEEGGGSVPATIRSTVNTAALGNPRYNDAFRKQTDADARDNPGSVSIGKGLGYAALAIPTALSGGWLATLGLGAAQGGLTNPESEAGLADDLKTRAWNAGTGAALSGGAKVVGAGAGKVGDWAMQKAVGAKEYVKGMGTRMANEGLWGTKGMMLKQIGSEAAPGKLAAREAALMPEIKRMGGVVPFGASVDAVSREGAKLVPKNPKIKMDPGVVKKVDAAERRALVAAERGDLVPEDAIDVARKMDQGAYDPAALVDRIDRDMMKIDSGAVRGKLKSMADSQGLPGVRDGLEREQALIVAREALKRPETFNQAMVRLATRASLAGAGGLGAGYASGNSVEGSLPYAAAAAMASTPMGLSTVGRGGTWASQAVPTLTPAMIDQLVRRSSFQEEEAR